MPELTKDLAIRLALLIAIAIAEIAFVVLTIMLATR
jgi:hypothetical protein